MSAEGKKSSSGWSWRRTFLVLILLWGGVFLLCRLREWLARREVAAMAEQAAISLEFEVSDKIGTQREFYLELGRLAVWENSTREALDELYSCDDWRSTRSREIKIKGYENKKELLKLVRREKWTEARAALDENVNEAISILCKNAGGVRGIPAEFHVRDFYQGRQFEDLAGIMEALEAGDGETAYSLGEISYIRGNELLPMDIAYALEPERMKKACENSLKKALKEKDKFALRKLPDGARKFSERYNIAVRYLSEAEKAKEKLDYADRPDVPAVGMSTASAERTKLGKPTRTTFEKKSWSHQEHVYGDMYWSSGGRQIFSAHYMDGKITKVYDTRTPPKTQSSWGRSYSKSSGSKYSSFDPDDHDIEAYYEDYQDIYEDYDDAYDGFLDDEDEWDNY